LSEEFFVVWKTSAYQFSFEDFDATHLKEIAAEKMVIRRDKAIEEKIRNAYYDWLQVRMYTPRFILLGWRTCYQLSFELTNSTHFITQYASVDVIVDEQEPDVIRFIPFAEHIRPQEIKESNCKECNHILKNLDLCEGCGGMFEK